MIKQTLLLYVHIDIKTRVVVVQVNIGNTVNGLRGARHVPVNVRVLVPRVGVIND